MGKIKRLIKQRQNLMSKAHRFNKRQQKLARMHPAVYDAMAMLVGPLVWDDDFEAIRMPLLRLIRAEARTGLHLRDLEALCRAIADEGEIK